MSATSKRSLYIGFVVGSFVSVLRGSDIKVSIFIFIMVTLGLIYWELTK